MSLLCHEEASLTSQKKLNEIIPNKLIQWKTIAKVEKEINNPINSEMSFYAVALLLIWELLSHKANGSNTPTTIIFNILWWKKSKLGLALLCD